MECINFQGNTVQIFDLLCEYMSSIQISSAFTQVLNFINQTNQIIFLTGKAGTGKTTLLKYIRQNTYKQLSIVAPTGVAAINAGGSTIHSFFQFPFTPFLPVLNSTGELSHQQNLPTLKYNTQRLAIFRNLELLIIDEISMVRSDLLDQMDLTLRQTRKKWHLPFGGVQILLIGDMHQLSPVVQSEEWKLLSKIYKSPYFFDSLVIQNNPPVYIELEKIYRQSDESFIQLLNKVRNNQLNENDLENLNSHYKNNISAEDYKNNITLTTHNKKSDEINFKNLNDLPNPSYTYMAKVEGVFSEKNYPADEKLILKEGTRVMFLKNNTEKNYYNGKIGKVTFINQDSIKVKCEEDKSEIEVAKETWTNVAYKLDKTTKHIDEEILGTFTQYPLRLAWAITIHKSQGLTFDRLIVDAADSFSAGQVYVALSRCRSLNGLTLSSKINRNSLLNDAAVLGFSEQKKDENQLTILFDAAKQNYIKTVLIELFDFSELRPFRVDLAAIHNLYSKKIKENSPGSMNAVYLKIDHLAEVSQKFLNQLNFLFGSSGDIQKNSDLDNRIKQASVYFETECSALYNQIKEIGITTENKEAASELNEVLQLILDLLFQKEKLTHVCAGGFNLNEFVNQKLKLKYPEFKMNVYASAKNTKATSELKHPVLFRKLLLLRDEICNESHTPVYMVAGSKTLTELTNFLPLNESQLLKISGFGKARVEAYGDQFLKIIRDFVKENNLKPDELTFQTIPEKKQKKEKVKKSETFNPFDVKEKKPSTKELSFQLYKQGNSIKEIAGKRGLTLSTIENHLIPFVANGEINIDELVTKQKQNLISEALQKFNYEDGLNPVKAKLPDDITFSEIRFVMAHRLNDSA